MPSTVRTEVAVVPVIVAEPAPTPLVTDTAFADTVPVAVTPTNWGLEVVATA
jgi:hypothetical protein